MSTWQGFALTVLVFSTIASFEQLWVLRRALASQNWSRTVGRVIATGLAPVSLTDGSATDVQPLVRYSYTVDGVEHEGQTLSIGEGWWGLWRRRFPIAEDFAVGSEVTVSYNPRKPTDSALLVGAALSTYLRPTAALMTAAWALSVLL